MWSAFSRLFVKNNIPAQPSTTVDTPESMDKQPQTMDSLDSKQVSIYRSNIIIHLAISFPRYKSKICLEMEFVIFEMLICKMLKTFLL